MNADELEGHLDVYLAIRSALGYSDSGTKILLRDLVGYLIKNNALNPITAQITLNWACETSMTRGRSGQADRLSIARKFLAHLHTNIPEVEIPEKGLLRSYGRPTPYIFSQQQVIALIQSAERLRPRGGLRRHTYSTIIGLPN